MTITPTALFRAAGVAASTAGLIFIGVQMGPGATALTRIPRSITSWARPLVKVRIAPLVLAYASNAGVGW